MPAVLLLGGAAVAPRDVHIPSASTAPQFRGGGGPRYSRPTGLGGWAAADAAIARGCRPTARCAEPREETYVKSPEP
jgi:hypothetical protein